MTEVVISTRNRHKAGEIAAILPDIGVKFLTLEDFPSAPEVAEDGRTLEENAVKKAKAAAAASGRWALADDTGLEVECLGGLPGLMSARFAGPGRDYAENNEKLLKELSGVPFGRRKAVFRCVMALASPEGRVIVEQGTLEGFITEAPRGSNGFGYDPLFLVPDGGRTLAEMSSDEKNIISHRHSAVLKMIPHLRGLAEERP